MIEKVFYNETEFVKFDIPEQGNVGALMSGGADSSLMAYILAHTIKKHNLKTKVYPVTTEMLRRPYNLRHSFTALKKITELTGFNFELQLCFITPNHENKLSDEEKIDVMNTYTRAYANRFELLTMFNGLTKNPPLSVVPDTEWSSRPQSRDDFAWRLEQENKKGLSVPFIHIDKKAIGSLYKKFNVLNSLLPLTRSCEGDLEGSQNFTKDCFELHPKGQECWWCRERAWGFENLL